MCASSAVPRSVQTVCSFFRVSVVLMFCVDLCCAVLCVCVLSVSVSLVDLCNVAPATAADVSAGGIERHAGGEEEL